MCTRVFAAQGKYDEAEPLYKESLAIRKKVFGDEHPSVATGLNNLAGLLKAQVRYKCKPFPVLLSAFCFVLLSHVWLLTLQNDCPCVFRPRRGSSTRP